MHGRVVRKSLRLKLPGRGAGFRRRLLTACVLMLVVAIVGQPVAALERTDFPPPRRPAVRLLVLPVDFVDPVHQRVQPNHRPWQTAALIQSAFFGRGWVPSGADGRRLASGSAADYVASQMPGLAVEGRVHEDPAGSHVQGWYQFRLRADERPYFGAGADRGAPEQGWYDFYAALLERLGITEGWLRERGYTGLYVLTGGPGGSGRCPGDQGPDRGVCRGPLPVAHSGFDNQNMAEDADTQPRYDWLGTLQHELVHQVTGLGDFYGPVWEHDTTWDLLSVGNWLGSFPAPIAAWATRWAGLGRVE